MDSPGLERLLGARGRGSRAPVRAVKHSLHADVLVDVRPVDDLGPERSAPMDLRRCDGVACLKGAATKPMGR